MVGDFVWTERDPPASMLSKRGVGLGAYTFDCHWCSLYVLNATTTPKTTTGGAKDRTTATIAAEGRVNQGENGVSARDYNGSHVLQTPPYKVPYDTLLPKRAELTNVLVPTACSSSHVRINAVRMEPAWAIQGHAAGCAAALAASTDISVQDVDVAALQKLLLTQRQKLEP